MTWILSDSGTKTATVAGTCTISNASPAVITILNTCVAGDMVVFATTGALPTGLTAGTTYYVISAGLSSSQFEVSATSGGSAINTSSAGSGTHTATLEQVLATDTNNGTFVLEADTHNMALGDLVELRAYTITLPGGTLYQAWKGTFQHAQINAKKIFPPVASDQSIMFTLKQLAGTGRSFPWKALRI
jgi:hypothetical protein